MNKFQQYGVLYIEQVSSGVGGFVLSIHLRCEAFNIKCTVIETYSCIFLTFTLNFREVNSSWIVVEVDDNVYEITFFLLINEWFGLRKPSDLITLNALKSIFRGR